MNFFIRFLFVFTLISLTPVKAFSLNQLDIYHSGEPFQLDKIMPEPLPVDLSLLADDDIEKLLKHLKKVDLGSQSRDEKNLLALAQGYLNYRKGDYKASINFLRNRILGNFILNDLRLHFESNSLREHAVNLLKGKNYSLAVKSLLRSINNRVKLFELYPDSPFYEESLRRLSLDEKFLGDIYQETFNYKSAWQMYRRSLMRDFPDNRNHKKAVTLALAKTYEAANDLGEAADSYAVLLNSIGNIEIKESAINFFEKNEKRLRDINIDLHLYYSVINQASIESETKTLHDADSTVPVYHNSAVREFYEALATNNISYILETGRLVLAQYPGIREARGIDRIIKNRITSYLETQDWMILLDPVVDLLPARELSDMGLHLWKMKRPVQAAVFYKRIIYRYPLEIKLCHKALYFLGRIYEDLGDYSTALRYYHLLLEKYDFGAFSTAARFKVPWIERVRGQYTNANFHFKQLILFYDSSDYADWKRKYPTYDSFYPAAMYWLSHNESSLGNAKGRVEWLNKLITDFPFDFYSILARLELGLGLESFFDDEINVTQVYRTMGLGEIDRKRLSRSERLIAVGFFNLAAKDLEKINSNNSSIGFKSYLARLLNLAHGFQNAILLNWNILKNEGDEKLSGPLARGLFPNAWMASVENHAKQYNLDPLFILSLMRQESAFNEKIVSSANAIGLMQLLPATATDVAGSLDVEFENVDALKDPDVNIMLGVNYLNRLLISFGSNPIYALASYNAGDHKVREWIEIRGTLGPVEFIESIPYNETRNYVKKILRNYIIYLALYKNEHVAKLKDLLVKVYN